MSYRLYTLYRRTERIKQWFSSRFTQAGKHFLLVVGIAILFGIEIQSTMIHQIFGIAASLLFLAFLATLRFRANLKIQRILPPTCVAGRELKYILYIENQGRKTLKSLLYREHLADPFPTWQEFRSSREKGEERRNIFDRKMIYYRWLWLLQRGCRLLSGDQELPELAAGKRKEVEISLFPLRRGTAHLSGYMITRVDPLGLCKHQIQYAGTENILVLPRLFPVPKLYFPGSRKYHQGGITAAANRGESNEFLSLREYSYGDPIKHIDWKSTARTGKTIVKQYRDEYFSRYGLILDPFTPPKYSDIFEQAVSLAASIMMTQESEHSVLDLFFVGNECVTASIGRGLADRQKIMEILASVTTCQEKCFAEMSRLVKSHLALLSGIVLILIDLDEQRNDLITYLAGNKIPMKIMVIIDNREEFAAKKRKLKVEAPLRAIDLHNLEEQIALL